MTKIVYNACYGGFGLSHEAVMRYAEIKGITLYTHKEKGWFTHYTTVPWDEYKQTGKGYFYDRDIDRADPALVQVVEEMGHRANGQCANLCIEDVPEGTLYRIDEYDGFESIETNDSYDWKVA